MPAYSEHAITLASFEQIDREIGEHPFTAAEYAIARRVIHTTADFEFKRLIKFCYQPVEAAITAFRSGAPIITDVSMVAAGIGTVVERTWQSQVTVAVQQASHSAVGSSFDLDLVTPAQTRSAMGMASCVRSHPGAIVAIGNAPTALMVLCQAVAAGYWQPALVIGAPVGFINVVESKQVLSTLSIPHILVEGRKGGSAVAAAILNAVMIWAWEA
ncbi:precorrin-8X methylmutase subfamily [Synechococcus sp. PCC 7335]|uniref:precorrin-8X methylmutase n=1 Tax=Synechococcus sp. (strain ATCC 29403 / PCC 7335) TaxID=91464 RepID=UPI00017ED8F9|nr:precorrin-8X methylmutase [Synechococcus sp. PCC 7335]EDX85946.1 precorrin-8X methylmutase subfamily [Synechococcus sp. PCC 7335]